MTRAISLIIVIVHLRHKFNTWSFTGLRLQYNTFKINSWNLLLDIVLTITPHRTRSLSLCDPQRARTIASTLWPTSRATGRVGTVLVYLCTCVLVYLCTCVLVCWCTCVLVYLCTGLHYRHLAVKANSPSL